MEPSSPAGLPGPDHAGALEQGREGARLRRLAWVTAVALFAVVMGQCWHFFAR